MSQILLPEVGTARHWVYVAGLFSQYLCRIAEAGVLTQGGIPHCIREDIGDYLGLVRQLLPTQDPIAMRVDLVAASHAYRTAINIARANFGQEHSCEARQWLCEMVIFFDKISCPRVLNTEEVSLTRRVAAFFVSLQRLGQEEEYQFRMVQ